MGEDLRSMFEDQLKADIEGLEALEEGSEERERAVKEIESLTRLLNDNFKNQQVAWDQEESRRIDEETRDKQNELDEKKSKREFWKTIAAAALTSGVGLLGLACGYHHIYKMEAEGILPNREAMKQLPRLKFW